MNCPKCGSSRVKSAFGSGGIESVCLDCAEPVVIEVRPSTECAIRLPPPVGKPPIATTTSKPIKATERDVIRMARAQLKTLNAEIKRLEKLKVQRDALVRLLAAADAKPEGVANVRPLRASQGK